MKYRAALLDLEKRSYWTYRVRLETERRLRRVGLTWNAAQTAQAVGLIAVSVLYLAYPAEQSILMLVYLISLSVLALAVSVTVGALDYSGRAREMFRNYRSIQALSVRLESAGKSRFFISRQFLELAYAEYNLLLDNAENHSRLDWDVYQARKAHEQSDRTDSSQERDASDTSTASAATGGNRRLRVRRAMPFLLPSLLLGIACFTALSAVLTVII